MKFKVLDLFSGIGGFSLGLEKTGGFETVAFCEIEEFPRKVLNKHWPNVPIYEDVRNVTAERLRADGIVPDVITGGFPCQDISVAGNQAGIGEGTRSGLWSECARLLGDICPRYAIFENVTALLSGDNGRWFEQVLWDISKVGYDAEWHCISASELGAHHHRDRVWIIAYPKHDGCVAEQKLRGNEKASNKRSEKKQEVPRQSKGEGGPSDVPSLRRSQCRSEQRHQETERNTGKEENVADTQSIGIQGFRAGGEQKPLAYALKRLLMRIRETGGYPYWQAEPSVGRVVDGIPDRAHRIKGLGNAVVPQIPELIGMAILEAEKCN